MPQAAPVETEPRKRAHFSGATQTDGSGGMETMGRAAEGGIVALVVWSASLAALVIRGLDLPDARKRVGFHARSSPRFFENLM